MDFQQQWDHNKMTPWPKVVAPGEIVIPDCTKLNTATTNDINVSKVENGFILTQLNKTYVAEHLESVIMILERLTKKEERK